MRITCANKQQLDEIYIHDALFDGFSYDYERRTIGMVCSKPWEYWRVSLCFENVIFFSHQSCDFWGRGENVMWLSVVENPEALQKLLAKQAAAWEKTRQRLREKLLSPQPPEKKVSRYRLYQCSWQLGDVYAYRLTGGYAVETGFAGQYVVFRKVSEDTWWPGHVIPVVQVYQWIGSEIPALDTLAHLALLPQNGYPDVLERMPGKKKEFELKLICTSSRSLPKENLCFLGNLPGEDLHPFRGHDYWTGYCPAGWEGSPYNTKFERHVIDMYLAWKDRQAQ